VPEGIEVIVVVDPVPVFVVPPGVRVTVHCPEEGNPLSKTLPVDTAHVGWVMVPITGASGVEGGETIFTTGEEAEVQPA